MTSIREVLRAHRTEILYRWTQRVRGEPFAEGLSSSELISVIPELLDLLGQSNVRESARLGPALQALIERHLSNRLRHGSTLNEILTEFSSLTQCITAAMENDAAADRLSAREAASLFAELHVTCVAATKIFNEHLLEDEQPEKRFVRLLQKISADGLSLDSTASGLRARLEELLALIMRAMAAHTAALLLFDANSQRLVMSASTGDAHEQLERHVSSLDVTDVAVTELEVSDPLRSSGIRSLLGVRLSSGHTLRGVLYIGVRAERSFSAGEIRRFESLGEVLTVHLDNAQLNAALRAKVREAAAESQLRERFVSILMNDLNRPLMAAKVDAQQLLDAGIPEAEGMATSILYHLDHIEELVSGLVEAQRVRAGDWIPINTRDRNLG